MVPPASSSACSYLTASPLPDAAARPVTLFDPIAMFPAIVPPASSSAAASMSANVVPLLTCSLDVVLLYTTRPAGFSAAPSAAISAPVSDSMPGTSSSRVASASMSAGTSLASDPSGNGSASTSVTSAIRRTSVPCR